MESRRAVRIRICNIGYKIGRVSTYLYLWDTLHRDKECGLHEDREAWNTARASKKFRISK